MATRSRFRTRPARRLGRSLCTAVLGATVPVARQCPTRFECLLIGLEGDAAPLTLTGTATGLSVSPSTVAFGEIADGQVSAPQTVLVRNVTDQELPLSLAANGSVTPAGISVRPGLVHLETRDACPLGPGAKGPAEALSVPASSVCEVGVVVEVRPARARSRSGNSRSRC